LRDDKRDDLWKMLVALVVLLAGLAVMFVGLQAARSEERSNPALRRLVFGYNSALGGLLLLILLAVVNAYVSARYTAAIEAVDRGVLVVRGEEKPENATFLRATDLYAEEGGGRGEMPQLKFKGEDRIVAALMTDRAVVYFTQGAGEADLNDTDPRNMEGLGVL